MKLNTTKELYQFLEDIPSYQNAGTKAARFDLERFRKFCEAMGNPHQDYPSIHIAGTNGKGSTCQILGAIYHEAGYKTGLFTSPHLIEYRERFQIDGEYITDEELLEFLNKYNSLIRSFRLTYFEVSTAIAFWWFSVQDVDLAIIEVGLGGRLDATNVITPLASVITNISLDHTDILGETVGAIAREKAGIIKPQVPVITGNVGPEAEEVINEVAGNRGSAVYKARELNPVWNNGRCLLTNDGKEISLATDLYKPVQAYNIAVAWQVIAVLEDQFTVSEEQLRSGTNQVKKIFKLPGRFEKLHPDLEWYFDGAHNLDAVQRLTEAVAGIKPLNDSVLILSMMEDKVNQAVMEEFQKFKKIYYYGIGSKRAAGIEEIRRWLPGVEVFPEQKKQQTLFLKELESKLVIFAGSFYFYVPVRQFLTILRSGH